MRILKNNVAAVCIDIQEKLFPYMQNAYEFQNRSMKLIKGLKTLNIPVIVTEQYVKGLGETISPVKKALGDSYKPLEKSAFSIADDDAVMHEISNATNREVILFGMESHVCVLQSVIDLLELNYLPVVVEDCVSSRFENDKNIAFDRVRKEGAVITTYESILFELLRETGTEEFKEISKIVK